MYVNRVELRNIRQFQYLDLLFQAEVIRPIRWSLFVGDNATGKTTLLRSIALGLCDESSAAGLVRELTGSLVRKGAETRGIIRVELVDGKKGAWTLETVIEPLRRTGDRVRQSAFKGSIDEVKRKKKNIRIEPEEFPWQKLFVVAYGAGRDPEGGEEYEMYRNVDAVYTLFRYDASLQSPELGWRRLLDQARLKARKNGAERAAAIENQRIKEMLHEVLVLEENENLDLTPTGIQVNGVGYSTPLTSHADGYKATTTWVLDLLAWRMLFSKAILPENLHGIVLIDELEQHLHPRWQRYIIRRLAQTFPRVQFIATTHSPLCAAGIADLRENQCQLISLSRSRGVVEAELLAPPRGLRADQILTSDAFDLKETRNTEIGDKVERFRELAMKSRLDGRQKIELNNLRRFIAERVPEARQFEEEREIRDSLRRLLKELKGKGKKLT